MSITGARMAEEGKKKAGGKKMHEDNGPSKSKNSYYFKGIGAIVGVLTVLVGVVAVTQYLGREIEFVNERIQKSEEKIDQLQERLDVFSSNQAAVLARLKKGEAQIWKMGERNEAAYNKIEGGVQSLGDLLTLAESKRQAWMEEHHTFEMAMSREVESLVQQTKVMQEKMSSFNEYVVACAPKWETMERLREKVRILERSVFSDPSAPP